MSIIQTIRDKAAPVVIGVIAISLIGFILMDAGRSGLGGGVSPTDAVGDINGSSISYATFLDKVKFNEQVYEMNGRPVDENVRQQLYGDTWRSMVEGELLNQEVAKLGLTVTDKEFNDMLFGVNPPEFLRQQFVNDKGEFDAVAAKQAFSQMKKAANNPNRDMVNRFYLEPFLEGTLRTKYFSMVQNSVYVPKWMAEKTMADNGTQASFSYVAVPYSSVADSSVVVSDDEILAYARSHEKEFRVEEKSRNISYVSFPFLPSTQDTADVLKSLNDLKAEFSTVADPGAFVTRTGSSLPFYDGYNSKNRIQIAQKDSIVGSGVGTVYGPYLDVRSYVISRVVDVKTLPDSVKARHILVSLNDMRTGQPMRTDSAAKALIDSLDAQIKAGANFAALASQYSEDEGSKLKGGDLGYFAGGAMVKEFNDFCFDKKPGEKGIVKTQFGYHLIEVTDQKNFAPAYKIAYLSKPIEASQATISEAQNKASQFSVANKNGKAFDAAVTKQGLNKLLAGDIKETDFNVGSLGVNRQLVRDIYKADVGDVLDPVELADQFVVVAVGGEEAAGIPSANKLRANVETIVRNQKKAKQIMTKMGAASTLEAAAQATGVTVMRADSVSFISPMIQGVGYELKAGGFAFNKAAAGKVSKAFEGGSGVFMVKPEGVYAVPDATSTVESLQTNLAGQQKGNALYSSIDAMRKAAKIVDKRAKFL